MTLQEEEKKEPQAILDQETGEYVSKNELKKRIKARQKAAEKAEKAEKLEKSGCFFMSILNGLKHKVIKELNGIKIP